MIIPELEVQSRNHNILDMRETKKSVQTQKNNLKERINNRLGIRAQRCAAPQETGELRKQVTNLAERDHSGSPDQSEHSETNEQQKRLMTLINENDDHLEDDNNCNAANIDFQTILKESKENEIKRCIGQAFLDVLQSITYKKILKRPPHYRTREDRQRLIWYLKRK